MSGPKPEVSHCRAGVKRLLTSDLLSHSPSLLRLLEYLAAKSLAGEGEALKEYTIGVEALGKPDGYDPQADPSVRSQVRRLRAKLAQYYEGEGADDPTRVALPKGTFQIHFESRTADREAGVAEITARLDYWRRMAVALALAVCLLAAGFVIRSASEVFAEPAQPPADSTLIADMKAIWQPYLTSERSTIVCLGVPAFFEFERSRAVGPGPYGGVFRDDEINSFDPEEARERLARWKSLLGAEWIAPWYNYMAVGEGLGAYRLGKNLLRIGLDVPVVRSNALSWDEIRASNVIYLGAPKLNPQLRIDDYSRYFRINSAGIDNLEPVEGERREFPADPSDPGVKERQGSALFGRYPARGGGGHVTVIGSSMNLVTWAAVEYLTRPDYARRLVSDLEQSFGGVPDYFEIVITARFHDGNPVEIYHEAVREVQYDDAP